MTSTLSWVEFALIIILSGLMYLVGKLEERIRRLERKSKQATRNLIRNIKKG